MIIRLDKVAKFYTRPDMSRHWIYRDLDLSLPEKTNVGIVGRNGAGKSTLMRLLSGVETPDQGQVTVNGSVSPPVGLSSGFSGWLSGRENAKFVCRIHGDEGALLEERLQFIRDFSELGAFFEQPIKTYSSGMRARLAFAISMSFDYDCYLMDEITSVGDEKFKRRASAAFTALRARASIILVSHSLGTLRKWCDAGLYIRDGRVHYYDQISDAIDAYLQDQK